MFPHWYEETLHKDIRMKCGAIWLRNLGIKRGGAKTPRML